MINRMMGVALVGMVGTVGMAGLASTAAAQPATAQPATTQAPSQAQKDTLWDQRGCVDDERGAWFRDAKFGAFIHFGLYSHLGGYYDGKGPYRPAEQIMGLGDRKQVIPWAEYGAKVGGGFNPAKFDAKRWVKLMKDAGQKYVILTTKHHDGFCMFKTATTAYNVVDATPFKRDVVKELADACAAEDMPFCVYYSIGDWTAKDVMNPAFGQGPDGYRTYMEAQLKELLTNYPTVKMLWFDNYWYVDNQWKNDTPHAKELYTFARTVKSGILVNDRCGTGDTDDKHGDYATPENQLKGSHQSRYFEVVMTNTKDDNWGWVKGAKNYRSADEIIRNLIDSASKGGNFVLNVGPNADGEFPPEHVELLKQVGDWTRANGEALYGTVPAPEVQFVHGGDAVAYATKSKAGDAIYIHVVSWPSNGGCIMFRPLDGMAKGLWSIARLPDHNMKPLVAHQIKGGDVPSMGICKPANPDKHATVFKLVPNSAIKQP